MARADVHVYSFKNVICAIGSHMPSGFAGDNCITITPQGDGITDEAGADGEVVVSNSDDPRYEVKMIFKYGGGLILISPYKNTFRVSQAYRHLRSDGTYHQGYDLVGIGGKHIYSPVYGTVIRAGWECATLPKKGFGQRVVLRVGCTNYYMYFGHLSQINVAAGQKLKPGDLIGVEGSTGHSTGSHLHWEIRINDIKTGYVSVYHYAGIPNMPGSAAYTSNWAAEIFGPGNLKKSTSGYPQRLYNAALQGALGINQDGIFGANTEKAVKAFQAAHNLTADGIVGTRTKAALSKLL